MDDDQQQYAVVIQPRVEQQDDTSWRAWYPESDWFVTADSKQAATQKLHDEYARRLTAGEIDTDREDALLEKHLAQPIPGVYAIDSETYLRIRRGPNFRQELDRLIARMDAEASDG
jgi:hypothetical protein